MKRRERFIKWGRNVPVYTIDTPTPRLVERRSPFVALGVVVGVVGYIILALIAWWIVSYVNKHL